MGVYIVIPAYNEAGMIGTVIGDLKKAKYHNIVVVDDNSKDNTYKIAKKQKVHALRHVINRGQGAALRTGIEYALEQGADIIVTFDADGQHQTKDIEKMIKPVKEGKVDVTLGSRFLKQNQNVSLIRRSYLKVGALVIFLMYGIKLTDSHNGLRAFSRKAAQKIKIQGDRMEHASEIPEKIHKYKLKFREIPVDIKYTDYSIKHGQQFKTSAFKIFFKMIINKLLR